MRPRAAGGPAPAPLAPGGGALAAHTPPHLGARRPSQVSLGRLRAPSEDDRELWGPLREARRGHPRPGTSGREPSRRALGPGQRGRRLLLSPGSRAAGPGEAEAPTRPAGGARRLCPAPCEQQRRSLRSQRGCENAEAQHLRPRSRRRAQEGRDAGGLARPRLGGPAGRVRRVTGGRWRGGGT